MVGDLVAVVLLGQHLYETVISKVPDEGEVVHGQVVGHSVHLAVVSEGNHDVGDDVLFLHVEGAHKLLKILILRLKFRGTVSVSWAG